MNKKEHFTIGALRMSSAHPNLCKRIKLLRCAELLLVFKQAGGEGIYKQGVGEPSASSDVLKSAFPDVIPVPRPLARPLPSLPFLLFCSEAASFLTFRTFECPSFVLSPPAKQP
jgi:hypothetical protein